MPAEQTNQMNLVFLICNPNKFLLAVLHSFPQFSALLFETTTVSDVDSLRTSDKLEVINKKHLDVKLCSRKCLNNTCIRKFNFGHPNL